MYKSNIWEGCAQWYCAVYILYTSLSHLTVYTIYRISHVDAGCRCVMWQTWLYNCHKGCFSHLECNASCWKYFRFTSSSVYFHIMHYCKITVALNTPSSQTINWLGNNTLTYTGNITDNALFNLWYEKKHTNISSY